VDAAEHAHEKWLPKTARRADAERARREIEAREFAIREGLESRPSTETLAEASARYLESIRGQRSWKDTEARWRLHILPVLGKEIVGQIRPTQIDAMLARLKKQGLSQQTRRHVLVTLGACYRWLKRDRVVRLNPVEEVQPIAVPPPTPVALTVEEVHAIARACLTDGMRRLVLAGFYTGMRPGELLGLVRGDVHLEDPPHIRVERTLGSATTKTGRSRVVPLSSPAVAVFAEALKAAPGQHLFLNGAGTPMDVREANKAFKRAVRRAVAECPSLAAGWLVRCRRKGCGFREERTTWEPEARCPRCSMKLWPTARIREHVSLKTLRSSAGTRMYECEGLQAASDLLGHADLETTKRHYIHLQAKLDRLAAAINRAFPGPPIHERPPPSPERPKDGPPSQEQDTEPVTKPGIRQSGETI
jgi:integrase